MTKQESFREGFIEKLAEMGVSPEHMNSMLESQETRDLITDVLSTPIEKSAIFEGLGDAIENSSKALGSAGKAALLMALLVPPAAGAAMGYAFTPRTSPADLNSIKEMRLLREYQSAIERLEAERGPALDPMNPGSEFSTPLDEASEMGALVG